MTIIDARDLVSFPSGNNATDTEINGVHFNLTALQFWNYTLYDNGTLSNGSKCMLTFAPYTPTYVFPNGTFLNVTSCYSPTNPIGQRGKLAIAFASLFGLCLVPVLLSLGKHGRLYLPTEKRFRPIGRRWQWYWCILTCAAAIISLLTRIDVDRYYMSQIPIVLTSFFWFLMQMCSMAIVWEAIRHWGSWMERQYIDPNPFVLSLDDRRAMFELLIPLVFYFFVWLNFFLIVPRNWGKIEMQHSEEQIDVVARPGATDTRFKIASFFMLAAWITIIVSLHHSIKNYLPRNRGLFNRARGLIGRVPLRHALLLVLSLTVVAFQALVAWEFDYSILNIKGNVIAIYVGGYLPTLLIVLAQVLYGWIARNEDKELIRQRRIRGADSDRELGIVHKPAWWRRLNGDAGDLSMNDRIARNVRELGGGAATGEHINRSMAARDTDNEAMEMNDFSGPGSRPRRGSVGSVNTFASTRTFDTYAGKSDRRRTERTLNAAASLLFPNSGEPAVDRTAELTLDGPPPPYRDADSSTITSRGRTLNASINPSGRSSSRGTLNSLNGPPQQVRSMLDL